MKKVEDMVVEGDGELEIELEEEVGGEEGVSAGNHQEASMNVNKMSII